METRKCSAIDGRLGWTDFIEYCTLATIHTLSDEGDLPNYDAGGNAVRDGGSENQGFGRFSFSLHPRIHAVCGHVAATFAYSGSVSPAATNAFLQLRNVRRIASA